VISVVDLNDPKYEFVKDDQVFLMDFVYQDLGADLLYSSYEPRIPEEAEVRRAAIANGGRRDGPGSAARLAATDSPSASRRTDAGSHAAAPSRRRVPQSSAVRHSGRRGQ
jgi:hypothetical protein